MLHIRPEQLEVLISGKTREFKRRLAKHLHRYFPEQSRSLGVRLPHVVALGMDRARFYGFRSEREICKYLNLMFQFGHDFDKQPDFIWATIILTNPKLKRPDLKMRRLYAEAIQRTREEAKEPRESIHE